MDTIHAEKLLEESANSGDKNARRELNRIRNERAEQERKLAQEKAEQERKIAQEKAEKKRKIEKLSKIEDEIEERKERVNSILKGTFTDKRRPNDCWQGFDAGKIAMTDTSASVTEEQPLRRASAKLSDTNSLEEIDDSIDIAQK